MAERTGNLGKNWKTLENHVISGCFNLRISMSYSWEPQKVERKELEKVTSTERKRHCVGTWISVRSSQSPAPLISIFLLGTSQ
jgi:retron-type reverse transcriptase